MEAGTLNPKQVGVFIIIIIIVIVIIVIIIIIIIIIIIWHSPLILRVESFCNVTPETYGTTVWCRAWGCPPSQDESREHVNQPCEMHVRKDTVHRHLATF